MNQNSRMPGFFSKKTEVFEDGLLPSQRSDFLVSLCFVWGQFTDLRGKQIGEVQLFGAMD